MKKKLLTALFLIIGLTTFGQINMADSTVQVITYWDKGEKQNYTVTLDKMHIVGADTTSRDITSYDVEVTVLKQTDQSYTIEWLYKNTKTNNTDPITQKLINVTNEMKVIFKTDEFGRFKEVVNWKEVRGYIRKAVKTLSKDFPTTPEINKALKQITATYTSKKAIESISIKDIQQFHTFHGSIYKLGEIYEGQIKAPNLFGTEAFDSDVTLYLDEINEAENNFIIRSKQEINKEQLADVVFDHLSKTAKTLNAAPLKRENLTELKNETYINSLIHGTGWLIYSVKTVIVTFDNTTTVEEQTIELN